MKKERNFSLERKKDKELAPAVWAYCETCHKTLYKAQEENMVTRAVAEARALEHARYYQGTHKVKLRLGRKEIQ